MLVFAAAAMTAGFLTAYAQTPVYSVNTVGYVNLNLSNGYNLVANQLDFDGTRTNNTVQNIFNTNLPNGASVYAFSNGSWQLPAAQYFKKGGWQGSGTNAVNYALNTGGGVFIQISGAATVTLAGTVMQGNLATPYVGGYNIIASQIPQGGRLQTDLGYTPNSGDAIYRWNPTNQTYILPAYNYLKKGGWQAPNGEPVMNVGESFFLQTGGGVSGSWTRNFTVAP
jgi:hypothetical protein